jgi:hypothetical protein
MPKDTAQIKGTVIVKKFDADGNLLAMCEVNNLVTQTGDQLYAERGAGITSVAVPTGMKLGTGSTAAAKTGAGAALVTYLTDSHQAFDGSYPASSLNGSSRRIAYRSTWAAGKATTASPVTEVVIVNTTLADSTSNAAATISRAILSGIGSKGASDVIEVTWYHELLGA